MRAAAFIALIAVPGIADAALYVNEVASKGTTTICDGEDWVELFNNDTDVVALDGMKLHDDKGPDDDKAYTFPDLTSISPNEYLVVCSRGKGAEGLRMKIGGDDTITLLDASGSVLSTTGEMGDDGAVDRTWIRKADGSYAYTSVATPAAANVFTDPYSPEALQLQNGLGDWFFGMNELGEKIPDSDDIVELHATMEPAVVLQMIEEQSYEVYSDVQEWKTITSKGETVLASGGRIRPRGQSTLYLSTCMGAKSIPFKLDFRSDGKNQRLFGMEEGYLRNHFGDGSFMREWTMHRMLARFGIPYLRTRSVKFFINNELYGVYQLLEAPDQNYVFERSFPGYNRNTFSLYKFKSQSGGCGSYSDEELASARTTNADSTYYFERGSHRAKVKTIKPLGPETFAVCLGGFWEMLGKERRDVVSAYKQYDKQCGKMMTAVGLVDRDLGVKGAEPAMIEFFDKFFTADSPKCIGDSCSNVKLEDYVEVDTWLKNLAVYAVTVNQDSPIGNGNNWYAANAGDGKGYRIVQYDHNNILTTGGSSLCSQACGPNFIDWSIARPTCAGLGQNLMVGPLLLKQTTMDKYLAYVEDFTTDVFDSPALIKEIEAHARALQDAVKSDAWYWLQVPGYDFAKELSPTAGVWTDTQTPLLATMAARAASVNKQLTAIKDQKFPRLPAVVADGELCQDWTATVAPPLDSGVADAKARGCGSELFAPCLNGRGCFDHYESCGLDGEFTTPLCFAAGPCKPCYPKSRCGTGGGFATTPQSCGIVTLALATILHKY